LEIVTTQNKEKIIQKQKGVDILLATEMLTFAFRNNYDAAILCSGDQDFLPVLKEIKDLGKRIFVFGFESSVAFKLKNEADKFCKLDDYLNDFKLL
ncbi:MAG: NYN domain-containing protein, partial [Thermoplasmata archaeon]